MWFGTFDGLNRYDGYDFKVFRNKFNDTTSLQHNYIYAIGEDSRQNIWIGTGQGLSILDPVSGSFRWAYYIDYVTRKKYKLQRSITQIKSDDKGNLFIGTNSSGMFIKPFNSDVCVELSYQKANINLRDYTCQGISIDGDKRVWMFLFDIGLCYYDYTTGKIKLFDGSIKTVNTIAADSEHNIWMATFNGLIKYAIPHKKIVADYHAGPGQLSGNNVISLLAGNKHELYIGTDGDGMSILNQATNTFSYVKPGENEWSLGSKAVMDLYQDNESRIWIATLRSGINIIDAQKKYFHTISHEKGNNNSLVNNYVSSFCELDKNALFIGTEDGGLSLWNRKSNHFTNFVHNAADAGSLSSNVVTCLVKDQLNKVWVGTFAGGINRYNAQRRSFEHFDCYNSSTRKTDKDVSLLYRDSRDNLWAGTFSDGTLYKFDRRLQKFTVFDQRISDPYTFYEDRKGQLWCGTAEYIIKLDTLKKAHAYYRLDKPVRAIHEDKAGNFWIGTEGAGLCLFDRSTGKVTKRYTHTEGLSNNAVLSILEDESGKLWLSTFQGLTSFNYRDQSMVSYYEGDGLQSNQFSFGAALPLGSGELAFGGINGFNIFYPDSIVTRNYMPAVAFTNINVNNKKISDANTIVNNNGARNIVGLRVPYNEAVLSFSFAGLEYSSPDHIKYAYYLEGWDKNWIQAGNQRTINYNNIPEGNYRLHVRSTNALGKWSTKETTLKLIILPPWFRSWWAYLLYVSAGAGVIFAFIRYKTNQAKLKYQIKIERINSEKEHELNLRKTSFFTHVSHEFRTPLMLIINPLQEVLARVNRQTNAELDIVYRNARRLLSLIDQLLLFNKTENDGTDLHLSRINFYALCKLTYENFVYQARNKHVQYEFEANSEAVFIYGDKAKLEVILYNLLSNAFKFTKADGKIVFKLTESAERIEVSVYDNGAGIAPEVGDHLFEKFYRSPGQESAQKAGFGIGLYLVHQFVQLHKAEINYKSSAEAGTTFYLSFRQGMSHFEGMPVAAEVDDECILLTELAGEQELVLNNIDRLVKADVAEVQNNAVRTNDTSPELTGQMASAQKTMLVIDDHPDMRAYISQIFKDQFIIIEASDGNEGVQKAKEYIPDIIISDIMMDGKDGLELCKDIRENPSLTHIPLILITANSSAAIKLSGIKGGADDYFTKPFDKDLLTARIATLLNNRNNLQNYFYKKVTLNEQNVKISEDEKLFIDRCIAIIENRLDDDDFTIDELAKEINMSRSNLFKKIKAVSSLSPNIFVKYVRLRHAAELFINTTHNVNEVAAIVGFKDIKYFRAQFFQLFGLNPSDYIKKYRDLFSKKLSLNPGLKKSR
ncbi:two-component regulator propeller domain-containing protein [Mucilaginibacter gynuensis]|uniref:histidine kinase n=2 Tax=Mucilaginibacter gynuensis TaxID=1302236 RepID=A0ABP8G528_9SPHI